MDGKLKLAIFLILIFLVLFISIMIISENRNMEELKADYPDLPKESYEYRKDSLKVWGIGLMLQFIIPLLFLTTGLSQRISLWIGDKRSLFLSGLFFGLIFFGITFLIKLPLNYYSSFYLRHKYALSNQSILRWLELNIKGFLVNNLVLSMFLWVPYFILYRFPRTAWVHIGILVVVGVIFITFITPMVIDPLFNKYTSIEDETLGIQIGKLLEKAGIEDAEIYKVDKSKDTKTMNAYMTGISKSKRIVLWDTTINNLDESEVLNITAHEIGHYVKGHIVKNILLASIGSMFIIFLVFTSANWILDLSYGRFGFRNIYNYASLPLFILLLNFYSFFGNPVMNYVSRTMEVEADLYEISLTEDRDSAVTAMEKLYVQNLGLPRSSNLYKLWYHSHPSLEERVEFYKNEPFKLID